MKAFGKKTKGMLPIQSLIGSDIRIEGNVHFKGGLRIDGEVKGNVTTDEDKKSLLVISETGVVNGSICVGHIVVSGTILGPVEALELLELHPSAKVSGDVKYKALEMHPGAVVDGTLHYNKSQEVVESASPGKLALASNNH